MATRHKRDLMFAAPVPVAVIIYVWGPLAGCWYKEYRFDRYVHVEIDVPSCGVKSSETASGPCRYIFSFDGEREPGSIQFEGSGLQHNLDPTKRTYTVSGLGRVLSRNSVIEIAPSQVLLNNEALPRASQPQLIFVRKDGDAITGYCELRW